MISCCVQRRHFLCMSWLFARLQFTLGSKMNPLLAGYQTRSTRSQFVAFFQHCCFITLLSFFSHFFSQLNYQGRVISYKAEGRIHKLKWVYDGTAWDIESGTSVKAKHYQSKHGAIEHAVKELIDKLKANGIVTGWIHGSFFYWLSKEVLCSFVMTGLPVASPHLKFCSVQSSSTKNENRLL